MTKNSFLESILKIALPVTVQCMLKASFSIVEQVMIGQLGSESISGIGLGGKFASIHGVVLGAVTAAAAIMISQYIGQKKEKKIQRSFWVNFLVAMLIAFFFTAISLGFTQPILSCYTKDLATREIGETYLRIYAWSFFPAALAGMAETMLCCMEAAVFPLIASITSLICNTALNYVLIFGKFGFPELGVTGAAIASVISQILGCILTYIFLFFMLRKKNIRLAFDLHFQKAEYLSYAKILLPLLACEFMWSLGENIYSGIYGNIGTKQCAAMTMTSPIQCLMVGALSGLAKAAGIMVGKSLGNQEYEQAYKDSKKLMRYGFMASVVLSVVLLLAGKQYTNIYNVEPEVRQICYQLLIVFAIVCPIKVQNMILGGGILRSGGKTNYVLGIDLIGTWGFGVPLGLISAFVLKLPIPAVYFILSLEEGVRLLLSYFLFHKKIWMQKI
ncbi:MAG: MATE family efflux transporter [Roseburia sp.]|nr:MATE family efflux transporter [Roseburia sp.]